MAITKMNGVVITTSTKILGAVRSKVLGVGIDTGVIYLYAEDDAASPTAESNSIGASWFLSDSSGGSTFNAITGGAQDGSYFLQCERTSVGAVERSFYINVESGSSYKFEAYATNSATGGSGFFYMRTAGGWNVQQSASVAAATGTWTYKTMTGVATSTGTAYISFKLYNSATAGEQFSVDNIIVTKL
jgi:hypothetical protein